MNDVYGGEKYQELKEFTAQGNLTLTANTDGVQLFKSSTVSMWPIWILINELPITMRYELILISLGGSSTKNNRFSKKNKILSGIWCAKEKPTMNLFLKPLMDSMNELYFKGIMQLSLHN